MRPEEYARIVLRRWWLVPLLALTAALVAYVATDRQPRVYNSSTELIAIGQPPDYWMDLYAKNRLASYKRLVAEPRVLRRAVELGRLDQLGLDAGAVGGKLALAHNPDTNTVQIAASDGDPNRAARIANAVAAAFVEQNAADNEALIRQLSEQSPCELPELRAICERDPQLAQQLRTRTDSVKWVELRQLAEAGPAAQASAPRPKLNAAAAAILGAALALVLAFALEYLDDTLRTADDVRRHLDLPVVAGVPATGGPALFGARRRAARGMQRAE